MSTLPAVPASTPTAEPTMDHRMAAMELFLQNLVLVAECEPRFTAEALERWLAVARSRMRATGSTQPDTEQALALLQRRVMGAG